MTKIIANITLYHPNTTTLLNLIDKLLANKVNIFIWDNAQIDQQLKDKILSLNCIYQKGEQNIGLAAAQNIAIDHAISNHYDFIWLFDQDSEITSNLLAQLLSNYGDLNKQNKKVAAIGPSFTDSRFKSSYRRNRNLIKKATKAYPMIIASGSLIPISALQDIGPMNAQLFMDFIDTEWCYRAHKKGYQIFKSSATMEHSIGSTKKIGPLTLQYNSPERYYYFFRNSILLTKQYKISRITSLKLLIKHYPIYLIKILLLPNKKKYLAKTMKGIKDGAT